MRLLNVVEVDELAIDAIKLLQTYIDHLGYSASIHFELEGCFSSDDKNAVSTFDYQYLSQQLKSLNIDGQVIPEYWSNQWEYVSLFNGQSPLKEAQNLTLAIKELPALFASQGIDKTFIKPVVWSGDSGKLAFGSKNIFTNEQRAVHIPNAIQMNVSARDSLGENIIPKRGFGECLQRHFLKSSLSCCLLFLPEEDAYERLLLKDKYGLADELCSPNDISGGHQGSIALYKKLGKHNQKMGITPLVYDRFNNVILSEDDWTSTARIEHRLGASSVYYNAYVNVVFGLLNLALALDDYVNDASAKECMANTTASRLPESLHDQQNKKGAITLFTECDWFENTLNKIECSVKNISSSTTGEHRFIGRRLKQAILQQYQQNVITSSTYLN